MRLLRHAAVQRLLSAGLLLGLGLWVVAPALGATVERTVETEWLGAPPAVEAAFAEALSEVAVQGAPTPDAIAEAFTKALAAQSDPDLARFLEEHPPETLLSVLYGQWVRALSHHRGLEAAPAPLAAAPTVAASGDADLSARTGDRFAFDATSGAALPGQDVPPIPFAERSSAQPLGP